MPLDPTGALTATTVASTCTTAAIATSITPSVDSAVATSIATSLNAALAPSRLAACRELWDGLLQRRHMRTAARHAHVRESSAHWMQLHGLLPGHFAASEHAATAALAACVSGFAAAGELQ